MLKLAIEFDPAAWLCDSLPARARPIVSRALQDNSWLGLQSVATGTIERHRPHGEHNKSNV